MHLRAFGVSIDGLKPNPEFANISQVLLFRAALDRTNGADVVFVERQAVMSDFQMVAEQHELYAAGKAVPWLDPFTPAQGVFGVLEKLENEVRALSVTVGEITAVVA